MRRSKLKLNVDELSVESFRTVALESRTGTVNGHSIFLPSVLNETDAYSCGGTCGTCGGTDCYA